MRACDEAWARDTWRACLEPFRKVGARAALEVISLCVDRFGDSFELLARRVELASRGLVATHRELSWRDIIGTVL